jgi:hypothetical protein
MQVAERLVGKTGAASERSIACIRRVLMRRMSSLPSSSGDVICQAISKRDCRELQKTSHSIKKFIVQPATSGHMRNNFAHF